MASDSDSAASFLEQLINTRNRDISLLLPLILGFSRQESPEEEQSQSQTQTTPSTGGRIVLINPLTQGMIVIESSRNLEDLFRELALKEGQKPASKASIEAMPKMVISSEEDCEKECAVCLDGWEIGGEAREMPCKHRYHSGCIEKWLGMHGSCPVCRYSMPVDEGEESRKVSSDGEEERGGGRRAEIWVSFAFNGSRRDSTPTPTPTPTPPPAPAAGSDDGDSAN